MGYRRRTDIDLRFGYGDDDPSPQGSAMQPVMSLPKPDELRHFVRGRLCEHDRLDPQSAPFFEGVMKRGGRVCGLYFEVQGPRLTRCHAIWVGEEHRILFYDSTGARFAEVRLSEAPDPGRWPLAA